nr:P-selectin-like [Lytechinus pictus]
MCAVTSLGDKVNSSCTSGSQVNYEEECTFSCSTGYELVGPSSVNCTSSGNFSHSFPECQVTCEVSELGENVNSSCTPGEEVSLNQKCAFSCPTGYDLTGQSSVSCTSSGNFSDPFPQCQIVMCAVTSLGDKVNSSCTSGSQVNYEEECTFSCSTGYELVGPSSVNCTSSGNFSHSFPECQVTCEVSELGENVNSSCTPGEEVSLNQECAFSCPTGYDLTGQSSVTCTSSGNFSDPFPQCQIVMCAVTSLGDQVNSSCTPGSQVNYEEECTFSCPTGYELVGPSSVNCTSSGNFSHSFPECQVTCEVSELGENVNSSCTPGEEVSLNQECAFSCPTGYDLTGQSSVTCTSSGNFSDPFPQCQIVMCAVTSLGDQVNSSCTPGSQVNYEEECTFSCPTGYELVGPSSVNCTSSGKFSHSFPECQVTCEVSELGENVNSSCTPGEEVSLNQECAFSCPTGYDLTGQSSVTCTSSGNFSDPFPQCQIVMCAVTSLGDKVNSSCTPGRQVNYEEECTFSCPTGYALVGPSSVNCTSSGNFSHSFPKCQDIDDCDPPPCVNGGTFPQFILLYCDDGINSYTYIDDCDPSPCVNGGTCDDGINSYTCNCALGYTGMNCSTGNKKYHYYRLITNVGNERLNIP